MKVALCSTINQLKAYSYDDFVNYDVIVFTYQLMQNPNYFYTGTTKSTYIKKRAAQTDRPAWVTNQLRVRRARWARAIYIFSFLVTRLCTVPKTRWPRPALCWSTLSGTELLWTRLTSTSLKSSTNVRTISNTLIACISNFRCRQLPVLALQQLVVRHWHTVPQSVSSQPQPAAPTPLTQLHRQTISSLLDYIVDDPASLGIMPHMWHITPEMYVANIA